MLTIHTIGLETEAQATCTRKLTRVHTLTHTYLG